MELFNYTPYKVASKQDTNLASIVEVAVSVCFALLQDTTPLTNIKIYLDVYFSESTQQTKSELE